MLYRGHGVPELRGRYVFGDWISGRLMQLYPEAWKEQHVLKPAELGLKHIGHIAAFHPRNKAAWPGILGQCG